MGWRDGGILAQKYGIGKDRKCIALVTLLVVRRLLYYSCLGMFSRWTGDEGTRYMYL